MLCVADRSPAKQGKLLPGSHLPVVAPEALAAACPDDVVILPWNLADEIAAELHPLRAAGCRLWVAMPELAPGLTVASLAVRPRPGNDTPSWKRRKKFWC